MRNLILMLVVLLGSFANAQTTINSTLYHGVSGDNFITIANAWNNGDITDAWDWNNLNWFHNGNQITDINTLSNIGSGNFLHVRIGSQDHPLTVTQRTSGEMTQYYVVESIGVNGVSDARGEMLYNAPTTERFTNLDEAASRAQDLANEHRVSYQVWNRTIRSLNYFVSINSREYRIVSRQDASVVYDSDPRVLEPRAIASFDGWSLRFFRNSQLVNAQGLDAVVFLHSDQFTSGANPLIPIISAQGNPITPSVWSNASATNGLSRIVLSINDNIVDSATPIRRFNNQNQQISLIAYELNGTTWEPVGNPRNTDGTFTLQDFVIGTAWTN